MVASAVRAGEGSISSDGIVYSEHRSHLAVKDVPPSSPAAPSDGRGAAESDPAKTYDQSNGDV